MNGEIEELKAENRRLREALKDAERWICAMRVEPSKRCSYEHSALDVIRTALTPAAPAPALAERTRRALNKLRYMSSGESFLKPAHSDIEHLIRILEGEEDKT